MDDATVTLQQAERSSLPYVETLLKKNDLPTEDVRTKHECFYVGFEGDDPVGICGLEVHRTDRLLRSLVVERSVRGNGLGTAVCEALETEARREGIETLYLLTTTASEFFAHLGYEVIERSEAPATIRQTSEFEDLCPASATCMKKAI